MRSSPHNSMKMRMRISGVSIALVLAIFPLPSVAQSSKLLEGSQITEQALVDALVPSLQTRSIRPAGGAADVMITFETSSTELSPDGRQKLDIVGKALNNDKLATFSFEVQGHADPRGTPEWNQRLSEGRAEAVRQYLVESQSVAPDRLKPVGKGDSQPLNTANPAAAENRRVTFVTNMQ